VQAEIKKIAPLAHYTHCSSHVLSLALCSAGTVPAIRNAMGTIQEACVFFSRSAQRSEILRKMIDQKVNKETTRSKLKPLCTTRWVEKHDGVILFLQLYDSIVSALETIKDNGNNEAATKAMMLEQTITNSQFLIAMVVMEHVSALVLPLSKELQSVSLDLFMALELVKQVSKELQHQRDFAVDSFKTIFEKAAQVWMNIYLFILAFKL
jgi:hypothetical protein